MSEKTRIQRLADGAANLPADMRIAINSAWRGRQRGLAVIAGVFLAALVVTTVLAYSAGLSQIFLQESLEIEIFDGKVEQDARAPAPGTDANNSTFTNDTSILLEVCNDLTQRPEIADCTLAFGRQGIHQAGTFGNIALISAGYLAIDSISGGNNTLWENESFDFPEADENGPPAFTKRMMRLLGPSGFDGEIAERHAGQMLYGDVWPSHSDMENNRSILLPASIANDVNAQVGDHLDSLTFSYVIDTAIDPEKLDAEECPGWIETTGARIQHCRIDITIENLTISGIYEDWPFANPTLGYNPVFMTWTLLEDDDLRTLLDEDHGYLGVAVDRSQMPTSSTDETEDWLQNLATSITRGDDPRSKELVQYSGGVTLFWYDIISGDIAFLRIFLGLIQVFDYVLMIPIILLSLAVLIYGLVLSLEQRRREIAIHRTIGGSVKQLQRMVLREVLVMSFVAWLAGYLAAMAAVPLVLDAVGFMEFKQGEFEVDVGLGFISLLSTAIVTIGAAGLFGFSRTKEFLEMEIDEGVRRVSTKSKPKTWLHVLMFGTGILALVESWLEDQSGDVDLVNNFFLDGLLGIFGPFLLWIGGALILGRIAALGPRAFSFLLGWSPLLKDIRRGLRSSGSSESIGRLATIMVLTLSIVTLAAVQGATGTLVDEKTADATTGSTISLQFDTPQNATQVEAMVATAIAAESLDSGLDVRATAIPTVLVTPADEASPVTAWVVLEGQEEVLLWTEQAVPGDDLNQVFEGWQNAGYSAGESVAFNLRLPGTAQISSDSEFKPTRSDDGVVETMRFTATISKFNVSGGDLEFPETEADFSALFATYPFISDYSELNLAGQNLSGRDFSFANLSATNLSGADLTGANFSGAVLTMTNLIGADLTGANFFDTVLLQTFVPNFNLMMGANFTDADLTGAFGAADLNQSTLTGATCPDGTPFAVTSCASGLSPAPPPAVEQQLVTDVEISIDETERVVELVYLGQHGWIPGLSASDAESTIIIGEAAYRNLTDFDENGSITSLQWYIFVGEDGRQLSESDADALRALRIRLESNSVVTAAADLASANEAVERNGGLIFGTPGLLSLQFVVAALAAVASAFVFLSLVLTQRRKELAILQAIGASPNQVMRLVLFEILSIVIASMLLGLALGAGVAQAFNGFFSIFGFIFQIFGGASTVISRDLVWPYTDLVLVSAAVLVSVVAALVLTTISALRADLAIVLKGE
jgi:ABC-type lipoprotein release transport system permease subunit